MRSNSRSPHFEAVTPMAREGERITIRVPCRKCAYVRQSTDTAPEWQCPSCGVAYAKVAEFAESRLYPSVHYDGAYRARPDSGFPWKMWIVVVLVAVACAAVYQSLTKRINNRAEASEPPASSASAPARERR